MKKQTLQGRLTLGAALSALALAPMAQAQSTATSSSTTTTTTGTMSGTTGSMSGGMSGTGGMSGGMSGSTSAQPMMVTGRVNNYWTDASGFVTAVDIQTANGPAVVNFAPGMGNRMMQTYPIGSTANVWVQGSMPGGTQRWDMVGMGDRMPASGFWPVMPSTGVDLLTGGAFMDAGAERVTVDGKLRRVVVDKMGQVVGLVVETEAIYRGTPKTVILIGNPSDGTNGELLWESAAGQGDMNVGGNTGMGRDTTAQPDTSAAGATTGTGIGAGGNAGSMNASGTMSGGGMTGGAMAGGMMGGKMWTLVRVGQEFRPAPNRSGNMRRVTPLVAGDVIRATGYMEAIPYGAASMYGRRLVSSAISVNGRSAGQLGFPDMNPKEPVLLGFNLNIPFITGSAPDTLQVVPGGYEVYSGSSGSMTSGPAGGSF